MSLDPLREEVCFLCLETGGNFITSEFIKLQVGVKSNSADINISGKI